MSPGSGERGDGVRLLDAGGGTSKGKNHSSPPGGCGRRGRAGGALPGGDCPLLAAAQLAPRPRLIPGCRAERRRSQAFRWERVGGGEGGPGLPAPWALAAGRPGYPDSAAAAAASAAGTRRAGRGRRQRRRQGASRVRALTAPREEGAGRRRRRDPGATCWRSAAAAIPQGPGSRHPPAWPRGARRRSQRPRRDAPRPGRPTAPGTAVPCQALGSQRPVLGGRQGELRLPGEPGSRLQLACIFQGRSGSQRLWVSATLLASPLLSP